MKNFQGLKKKTGFCALAFTMLWGCSVPEKKPVFSNTRGANAGSVVTSDRDADSKAGHESNPSLIRAVIEKDNATCTENVSTFSPPELRLLTRTEYQNTLVDILGIAKDYKTKLPGEATSEGFKNISALNQVSDSHMSAYLENAADIAAEILPKIKQLAGCELSAGLPCAQQFVTQIGPKIWRRPLTNDEKSRFSALFQVGAAASNTEGMGLVIRAMLSSPNFLYRSEVGKDGVLTAHELASALSFFIWMSSPDDELRKLADSGEILKQGTLLSQANRLLGSSRAKEGISGFLDAYTLYQNVLGVNKDEQKYKTFTSEIRGLLAREAEDTMDYWVRGKKAVFSEMFTADYSIGTEKLAGFYDEPMRKEGSISLINHQNSDRRGLLGFASVLSGLATSTETHPVKRGEFVMEHLLCDMMASPPPGLVIKFPEVKAGLTTRERFAQHSSSPVCASCHKKLDGAGFGMEDFDAIGLHRDKDQGLPVNATGTLFDVDGSDHPFSGVKDLGAIVADSEQARRCFSVKLYQYAQGRFLAPSDVCGARKLADQFTETETVANMIIKVISSPAYANRREK